MTLNFTAITRAVGLMSGTSLDGTDLAACEFYLDNQRWYYKLIAAETIAYPEEWQARLKTIAQADAYTFAKTNVDLGRYFAKLVHYFIEKYQIAPHVLGSHGHTVFHQPELGFTSQIGDGATLAALTDVSVVSNFRSVDVALGGQGAPLVPFGDRYLFSSYQACLNLGGIANVSFEKNNARIAFDICPVNMILNLLAEKQGLKYDDEGSISRSGEIIPQLLDELNSLAFYKQAAPKSLGREWFEKEFMTVVNKYLNQIPDLLRTSSEHISDQIANSLNGSKITEDILVTGGGTHNSYLIELINLKCDAKLIVPDHDLIDYKEAIIFAFLAVMRIKNLHNVLSSATGSKRNNCGGALYYAG